MNQMFCLKTPDDDAKKVNQVQDDPNLKIFSLLS